MGEHTNPAWLNVLAWGLTGLVTLLTLVTLVAAAAGAVA
jgi:Mn2+/Fe2+ NRAMP family transporter